MKMRPYLSIRTGVAVVAVVVLAAAAVAETYRAFYTKLAVAAGDDPDDYFMGHTNTAYLVGPDGKPLTTFSGASAPETMARGIEKFLTPPSPSAAGAGREKPRK